MHAPLFSTITLAMELLIGIIIFFVIYRGYRRNNFPEGLALFAIGYEIVFNVGYMLHRAFGKSPVFKLTPGLTIAAAFHGILSLLMLIAVIVLFLLARKNYRRGQNYFREHRLATFLFSFFWIISLLSGIFLYFEVYF